jgi:hypothetical protein
MAVKDHKAMSQNEWINPINWRDGLPREIAVMQRLKSLENRNILGFRGYRLNMKQRRWRLFQDYCDYKNLQEVLLYYGNTAGPGTDDDISGRYPLVNSRH